MLLREVCRRLNLEVVAGRELLDKEVTGGYASDLLSWVMAHAKEGNIWVTIQNHQNVVAVANLLGLSVIVAEGVEAGQPIIERAEKEGVVMLTSKMPVYEICGRLYELGIKGGPAN